MTDEMNIKPYYDHKGISIFKGDALEVLKDMEAESVQTCVTSPPYWGLRDYGLPPMVWDSDVDCKCEFPEDSIKKLRTKPGVNATCGNTLKEVSGRTINIGAVCVKCGAWRGSLGLEPTPELYVEHLVQIFREVRRVLKKDGTLWLNLGDSYWGGKGQSGHGNPEFQQDRYDKGISFNPPASHVAGQKLTRPQDGKHEILKPKDLVGIPWRVAFALQADGWYLRSDIIWNKPNPMPESVTDRPTKSHEYIFLMSKHAHYFYDADAIREPHKRDWSNCGGNLAGKGIHKCNDGFKDNTNRADVIPNDKGANKRTVWIVTTKPYKEAHFATFPPDLIVPCIKAGSRTGDVVLDPFGGSMTTAYVSKELNRKAIMVDLKGEYVDMGIKRLSQEVLPL